MITPDLFINYLKNKGIDSFYGVPDSLLKDLCAYITDNTPKHKHIITANEGNAIAIASGHYIATGVPSAVYMQNSGLGNAINPLISLADEDVYNIPILLLIGWRGEPNIHDEPQHLKQGKITLSLLDTLDIKYKILSDDFENDIDEAYSYMTKTKKTFALIVKKGTFTKYTANKKDVSNYSMTREEAIEVLLDNIPQDHLIVSTTGKTSRELYELREKRGEDHNRDFLTVGSMGHTASISLGISLETDKTLYCIDGDGSLIMHLGGLGIVADNAPKHFKYIVINNGSHESVGGQPTIAFKINIEQVLLGLGFTKVFSVNNRNELIDSLKKINNTPLSALIINVKQGSRDDLGRPKSSPQENKEALMEFLLK